MAYVITEKCLGEQRAACIGVCPVECIKLGKYKNKPFAVIDPNVCIDCGVCLPECPIGAIVGSIDEAPDAAALNAKLFKDPNFQSDNGSDGDDGFGSAGVRNTPPRIPPPFKNENLFE